MHYIIKAWVVTDDDIETGRVVTLFSSFIDKSRLELIY
jgi:hypothetical protein